MWGFHSESQFHKASREIEDRFVVVKPQTPSSDLRAPGACVETGGVLRFARGSCLPPVPLSLQERLVVPGPGNDRPSGEPPPDRQVATHRMRRGLSGLLTHHC